eukprot:346826_1
MNTFIIEFDNILNDKMNVKLSEWCDTVHDGYANSKSQLKEFYQVLKCISPLPDQKLQNEDGSYIYNKSKQNEYLFDYTTNLYGSNNIIPDESRDYYDHQAELIMEDLCNDDPNEGIIDK